MLEQLRAALEQSLSKINIVIADRISAELGLSASELGLMTATYFLAFAAVLLPLGGALDRRSCS